nr:hypothetical protein [Morchella crassipes]
MECFFLIYKAPTPLSPLPTTLPTTPSQPWSACSVGTLIGSPPGLHATWSGFSVAPPFSLTYFIPPAPALDIPPLSRPPLFITTTCVIVWKGGGVAPSFHFFIFSGLAAWR